MEKYIKQLIEKNPAAMQLLVFIALCFAIMIICMTNIIVNNRRIEQLDNQIIENQQTIMMYRYGNVKK